MTKWTLRVRNLSSTSRSGRSGGCGLHDAHRAGSWGSRDALEPCTVEKVGQLRLSPFLTSSGCKHEDVEDVTPCVGLAVGENVLDDEHLGSGRCGPPNGAEDRSALLVGPIVQHLHQQVDVGWRQGIGEEVSRYGGEAIVLDGEVAVDDLGQVEEDP